MRSVNVIVCVSCHHIIKAIVNIICKRVLATPNLNTIHLCLGMEWNLHSKQSSSKNKSSLAKTCK